MAALKEWVRSLVMLVMLASILELLLPMNSMKKFVRMAMGLLIVLGVVGPIVGLLGRPVVVDPGLLVSARAALPSMHQIEAEAGRFRQRNLALAMQAAEARLSAEALEAARKVEGVAGARVSLDLVPSGGGEAYRVEGVTVTVLLGSQFGQVQPVEPVRSGVGVGPAAADGAGPDPAAAGKSQVDTPADEALAENVRREVAARLGLTDTRLIQVLVDRPGQTRR